MDWNNAQTLEASGTFTLVTDKWKCTAWYRYSMVTFLPNPHNSKTIILRLCRQCMVCFLWFMTSDLLLSVQCCIWYHAISNMLFDITVRFYCITLAYVIKVFSVPYGNALSVLVDYALLLLIPFRLSFLMCHFHNEIINFKTMSCKYWWVIKPVAVWAPGRLNSALN